MWYEEIKYASPKVHVDPEGLEFKNEKVPQGAPIKFRYMRGTFLYGVVCTNTETGNQWIDCREYVGRKAGKWHSFSLDLFKNQVLPKKVRKRRVVKPTSAS